MIIDVALGILLALFILVLAAAILAGVAHEVQAVSASWRRHVGRVKATKLLLSRGLAKRDAVAIGKRAAAGATHAEVEDLIEKALRR